MKRKKTNEVGPHRSEKMTGMQHRTAASKIIQEFSLSSPHDTLTVMTASINGKSHSFDTAPDRPLLEVLREDLHLTGTKYGCGEGQCRACTVLLDGKPVTSCLTPARLAEGKEVTTIEGLAKNGRLHRVQQAFLDAEAMQCGYCVPGMILRTVVLLETTPKPTDTQITDALNGNLCRCCGYIRILAAVRLAAQREGEASNAA
jgi:aerobic-type carbon monoxide dehydrogenase small subunit (CoxS/CutS family)